MSMYIGGDKIDGLYVKKTLSPGDTISYNDLTDKPFIPTAVTDLSDASNYALKTDIQTYTAGTGIDITNGVISNTQTSAEWGNITGVLSTQSDLQSALDSKIDGSSLATVATSGDYNDLVNKPTMPNVDQTYNGTSANAQSGVAIAGANFIRNLSPSASSNVNTIINSYSSVTESGTVSCNVILGREAGQMNSNGTSSSTITDSYMTAIGYKALVRYSYGTAIGYQAKAATGSSSYIGPVAIGAKAEAMADKSVAIGYEAQTMGGQNMIQIGSGINRTNDSIQVWDYKLLDKTTGKIPDDRLNTTIARTSDYYTKAEVDTMIGNIEAILQRLNSGNNS